MVMTVLGMFVELMTMWKKPAQTRPLNTAGAETTRPLKPSWWNRLRSSKWLPRIFKVSDKATHEEKSASSWHRRRIGVLFSKQKFWVFIVLIQPGDDGWKFCYRVIQDAPRTIPNAHCTGGLRFYKGDYATIENLINHITLPLKEHGPEFFEQILQDIFWGWEEFLNHVRSQAMSV